MAVSDLFQSPSVSSLYTQDNGLGLDPQSLDLAKTAEYGRGNLVPDRPNQGGLDPSNLSKITMDKLEEPTIYDGSAFSELKVKNATSDFSAALKIEKKQKESQVKTYTYPADLLPEGKDLYMAINFMKYVRPTPGQTSSSETNLRVKLPMPRDLQEVNTVRLDAQDTRLAGMLVNGGQALYNNIKDTSLLRREYANAETALRQGRIAEHMRNIAGDRFSNMGDVLLAGAGYLGQSAGGSVLGVPIQTAVGIASQFLGKTVNPHISVFFNGVDLRPPMEFSWLLSPRNPSELENIRWMVDDMRSRILPKKGDDFGNIITYPNMVELELYPWDGGTTHKLHRLMPRYKKGFIEAIHLNYTPAGLSLFRDNQPVFVVLSFIFQEIEVWMSEDYEVKEQSKNFSKDDMIAAMFEEQDMFGDTSSILNVNFDSNNLASPTPTSFNDLFPSTTLPDTGSFADALTPNQGITPADFVTTGI